MLSGFQKWISSYRNICDAAAILLFFVAFVLRMGCSLTQGRIVYAIDLMLFILRILEIFYVDRTFVPYVVMIGRMVNFTILLLLFLLLIMLLLVVIFYLFENNLNLQKKHFIT